MDDPFTKRERDILIIMSNGCDKAKEIAAKLRISRRTVEHHLANMRSKVGVQSKAALLYRAECNGWLEPGNGKEHG